MEFRKRILLGTVLVVALTAATWALHRSYAVALRPFGVVSGVLLLTAVLFLACLNLRKKLQFLPLLKASTWLQMHIYGGYFSIALFFFQIGFHLPRGPLEAVLASLFLLVSVSGIVGLFLSRWIPGRLTLYGENLIFERITPLRTSLRNDLEQLVLDSVGKTHSTTLADFYAAKLRTFFEKPTGWWTQIIGTERPAVALLAEVDSLQRYLSPEEKEITAQIAEYVRAKDNLDFQYAGQGLLKLWLFVHIPLSYVMIVLAFAHAWIAYSFS